MSLAVGEGQISLYNQFLNQAQLVVHWDELDWPHLLKKEWKSMEARASTG